MNKVKNDKGVILEISYPSINNIYNFSINTAPCSRSLTDLVPIISDTRNSVNSVYVLTIPCTGRYSALGPLTWKNILQN
jgi:hypothetical protein